MYIVLTSIRGKKRDRGSGSQGSDDGVGGVGGNGDGGECASMCVLWCWEKGNKLY